VKAVFAAWLTVVAGGIAYMIIIELIGR